MPLWNNSTPQQFSLRLPFIIIFLGFTILVSIHFSLHKLSTDHEWSSSQTRTQINLIHHLSEEIKGVQTLFFIWPTITDPKQQNQVHLELNQHIDKIFNFIRILEHGGPIPQELIPPDLAHGNNAENFTLLGGGSQLNAVTIQQLKTNLQTLFGDIEYLNRLLDSEKDFNNSEFIHIQQGDSALFSSLYGLTQDLIHNTKQSLATQQIAISQKQTSYKIIEVIFIIITLCTVFILTWWATRQLISSSHLLQNTATNSENETKRHQALNAILLISMQKQPLQTQLKQALNILIELMTGDHKNTTGAIFLIDPKDQAITMTVQQGFPPNMSCQTSFKDFSACPCGTCYQSGEIIEQTTNDHRNKCPAKNIYCIPIGPPNSPIGVLMLGFPQVNPSFEESTFLKFVTPILAGIILKSQYEHRLGKSELATLSIFQESDQPILLLKDNEIIDWNEGAATLFKAKNLHTFPAAHDLHKLLSRNIHTNSENPFIQHINTALSKGVSHGELRLRKQDGNLFLATLTFTTIPLHGEHIIYLVIHDISAREAEEKALLTAKNEAEKASIAKSTFLTTMSHEILTPLNAILGITTLTMDQDLAPETRENLEIIYTSSLSLQTLVTDILDISKIEADQFTISAIPFSLRAITAKLQHTFVVKADKRDILFTIDIDPNTPDNLLGDPGRLSQILSKLVTNGFKFTRQGSVDVSISCKKKTMTNCCILFTIKDTGIGIAKDNLESVFNDFTQVTDSPATRYGGVGLGLTISKRIVEKMGGTMWATSSLNKGSNFFIEMTFPLHQPLNKAELLPGQDAVKTVLTGKKILVVEDSGINLKVVKQILENMGMQVSTTENGEEGVTAMNPTFSAVLMDIEMPVMDGVTATTIIRQNHAYDHIPIIAITAHGTNEDQKRCFRAGMDDYMTKPVEPEVLFQVLSRNIQTEADQPTHPIDYNAGIIKVGGDQTFFNEILHDFCELHSEEGANLSQLFKQKEFTKISKCAHRLKAVAGTISAQKFAHQAKLLEELARNEVIDAVKIEQAIRQVTQCITEVLEVIERSN